MKTLKVSDKTTIIFGERGEGKTKRLLELLDVYDNKSLFLSTTYGEMTKRNNHANLVSSIERLFNHSRGTRYNKVFIDEFLLMKGIQSGPEAFVQFIENEFSQVNHFYLTTGIENLKHFTNIRNKEYAINK